MARGLGLFLRLVVRADADGTRPALTAHDAVMRKAVEQYRGLFKQAGGA